MSQFWGTFLTNESSVTSVYIILLHCYCTPELGHPLYFDAPDPCIFPGIRCESRVHMSMSRAKVGCTCPCTKRFCTEEFTYFAGAKKTVTVFLLFAHFRRKANIFIWTIGYGGFPSTRRAR